MKQAITRALKQCFAKYMSLYFVKDLIQGFSLVMKFEHQQGNEA